jgi:hypothetical protein
MLRLLELVQIFEQGIFALEDEIAANNADVNLDDEASSNGNNILRRDIGRGSPGSISGNVNFDLWLLQTGVAEFVKEDQVVEAALGRPSLRPIGLHRVWGLWDYEAQY